jgi:hypothetical protein
MGRKGPKRSRESDRKRAVADRANQGGAAAARKDRDEVAALAKEEEHVLRCLGAAVIMQWNDLSTHVQRELFDHATSMSELRHVPKLKGQIARFLKKHKDGDRKAR